MFYTVLFWDPRYKLEYHMYLLYTITGLLETPTEGRVCHSVCSKRSSCQECDTGQTLTSPGVVTFCMCEHINDLYGRREICPCHEEYFENTACSDEFDPYSSQCRAATTMSRFVVNGGSLFLKQIVKSNKSDLFAILLKRRWDIFTDFDMQVIRVFKRTHTHSKGVCM